MKIEMKIMKSALRFFQSLRVNFSYPPLNMKRILKDNKRFGRNFHNGLYGSLPGFAVKLKVTLHFSILNIRGAFNM